jgi:hypothetical protein
MRILHAKELTMYTDLKLAATSLPRGQLQRLQDARDRVVVCLQGSLWLTQEGDTRDLVLEAGDEVRIDRDGLTLLHALRDARYLLSDQAKPSYGH